MCIWNVKKLSLRLKNNTVTKRDKTFYLVYFLLLNTIGTALYTWFAFSYHFVFAHLLAHTQASTTTINTIGALFFICVPVILIVIGTYWCYAVNTFENFVESFICLSVPICNKIIVLSTLFCGIVATVIYTMFKDTIDSTANVLFTEITRTLRAHEYVGFFFASIRFMFKAFAHPLRVKDATISIFYFYVFLTGVIFVASLWYFIWLGQALRKQIH